MLLNITAPKFNNGVFIAASIDDASVQTVERYLKTLPSNLQWETKADFHFTIMYSTTPALVDYPAGDCQGAPIHINQVRNIGTCVALIGTSSRYLRRQYDVAKFCGLRSQWRQYIPHLSILKDPDPNLLIGRWPQPNFTLYLKSEYAEPLKT